VLSARITRDASRGERHDRAVPHRLLSLVAPPLCGICGDDCGSAEPICTACAQAIAASPAQPFTIPGADRAWAATTYDGAPRRLVAALKFAQRLPLAEVAACAIAARAGPGGLAGTLVPVPADPWRRRIRGFDPATELAGALSRRLDLPLSRCLSRRHAPRQVGKARAQRLAARPKLRVEQPPPSAAILLDDVVTTGATLAACARALRSAGCTNLLAVAFARA
jgi:predicted amidophosphoribosyltransferase